MKETKLVEKSAWMPLSEMRSGAIFETEEGPRYVKIAQALDGEPALCCWGVQLADGVGVALEPSTRVREVIGILPHRIEVFT